MNDINELNNMNNMNNMNNTNPNNNINKELIYEENMDIDSEEIHSDLNEESFLDNNNVEEKKSFGLWFDFSTYCNFNTVLVLIVLLGLAYVLFKEQIDSLLNMDNVSKPNLCSR